jgi:hypothetical protein
LLDKLTGNKLIYTLANVSSTGYAGKSTRVF